jgi:hypothetical protein
MFKSWFIATIFTGVLFGLVLAIDKSDRSMLSMLIVGLVIVFLINIFLLYPALAVIKRYFNLTFYSSILGSIISGLIGGLGFAYLILSLMEYSGTQKLEEFESKQEVIASSVTVSSSGVMQAIIYLIVIWGICGAIFWHLEQKKH